MSEPITLEQWHAEGARRFGAEQMLWRFVCPCCGWVAALGDWRAVGASEDEAAFSCIGRHVKGARDAFDKDKPGPCNYAGGGLFRLNPVRVIDREGNVHEVFAFAEAIIIVDLTLDEHPPEAS